MFSESLRLMHSAAELYYLEGKTQLEIADILGVSRPKVSRLLQDARTEGIVQISVINPFESIDTLTNALKDALGLSTVIVVGGQSNDPLQLRKRLGYAAAHYLGSALQRGDVLGIGWGRTLFEVTQSLETKDDLNLTIIPFMGGLGQIASSFQVHALARAFSEKFGGTWKPLYAPALVEDDITYNSLMNSRDVASIVDMWEDIGVALVGIGNIDLGKDVQMLFADYMNYSVIEGLEEKSAVGDICMRFFDIHGEVNNNGLQHVISIELSRLKKIPRRIGVAGGTAKATAILGAVRGGFINTLITDETAAQQILKLIDNNHST
jgi:deoxyribonucleoside regulator